MINLETLHGLLFPVRRITLSGAASAAMAKQGQFQAIAADTPIVDATDGTNAAGAFRLRFKPATVNGGPLPRSLVKVWVKPAAGTIAGTINGGFGTIVSQLTEGCIVVQPDATTGKVDLTVQCSTNTNTACVVVVEHGTLSSAAETITAAAA